MGHWIEIATPHGHVQAWQEEPVGTPRGAVIVLQEIFGVTAHIREVARGLAADGWVALAPRMFDLVEPGVELGYDAGDVQRGLALRDRVGFDRGVGVTGAAAAVLRSRGHAPAALGFCWGGTLAFLANTRLGLPAVSYYGSRTTAFLDEAARAPMLFHFGSLDASLPPEAIERHRVTQPDAAVHVHPADHGFNRPGDNPTYCGTSAKRAWRSSMMFLDAHAARASAGPVRVG